MRIAIRLIVLPTLCFPILGAAWAGEKTLKENEISKVTESFTAAWGRSDAAAMANVFLPNGSLVIPQGLMIQGHDAIQSFYHEVFARGYRGSHAGAAIMHIVYLRKDTAMLDGEWRITGAHEASGNTRADERGIFFAVVVHRDGKWRIAALREQASAATLQIPKQRR